ncbi:MAG: hypothetical protein NTU91_02640, partial [Chloroflexi bacterium]|nr:hypothetical protein [Chloroflexota bacterium]
GEAPVADYKAIWEEAHKEPEVPQPEPEIPGPETPEGEYDYSSKVTLAREAANPELSQRLETGEATEAELDKLAAKQPAVDAKMQATIDGVQAQLDKMLPGFSIEEQHVLMLADELAALSATEAKAKRLQGRVRSLEGRLKTALGRDAKLSLLLTDYEEGFRSGSEIQKGIAATRARLTELTEQDRRAETQAKMYVAKQTELARLKEWYRKRDAERRALLGYRELRKSLLKEIIRPPSAMVEYRGYADAILQIQRGLDPKRHTESVMREREKSRAYFDANPEAAALVPPERLDAIYSVPMADMSVRQLEEIQATIESLRDLGFKKRSIKLSQQFNARKLSKKLMVNAALRGEPPKDVIGGAKPSSEAMKLYLATLKPGRVAQMLDGIFAGITKSGEFWRMLVEDPNKNWNAMQKTIRKRQERVLAKMEELKLTPDPFAFKRLAGYTYLGQTLDIAYNGENFTMTNGEKPTVQKAMYWYIGMRNARTEAALLAGNKYPVEVIEAGIARLTPQMKEMADTIVQDFRDNQGRLHDAFVDIFNEDLPLEDNYLPMTRLQVSYETRNERVAAELTARAGVRKQFVARNPTYARIEIADEHQKPIADDIFNVWFEGVKIQEGFIHQDRMIKDMHSVLESDDVRNALQQRYGPAINKWMSKYINDLAQADSYATRQGIERWSRIARSNAAVAWLGFNLLSAGKQLWGAVNFLADTGPIYLAGAAAQFAAGKGKSVLHGKLLNNTLVDFVDSRSELVRHRQISQELQDLKRIDVTTYERLMQKVGGLGMNLLEVLDHATCVIGWKAMYDKVLRATKNEAMAIKAADEAVVRTQPSMRVQDAAEIYRSGEIMKWFTMFTSEMSAIWNRLAFDVPAAIRNGQLLSASADLLSIGIGGLGIALASGAMHGDDPEKKKQMLMVGFFGQYFEAIPLIGNDIYSGFSTLVTGKSRAANQGVRIFPYLDFVNRVPGNINADNYDKAIENLVQAMAMAAGLPVSGPKRMIKAISTRDAAALLGWE